MSTENVTTINTMNNMPLNKRLKVPTIMELLKSVSTNKHEWILKTPFQKWCHFYGVGRAAFSVLRIPFLQDTQKMHWLAYYTICWLCINISLTIYTAYYYIIVNGESTKILTCTCMLSLVFAVSSQIIYNHNPN